MTRLSYPSVGNIPIAIVAGSCLLATPAHSVARNDSKSAERKTEVKVPPVYIIGNARTEIRAATALSGDFVSDKFLPRTALGKRLLAIRKSFVAGGGELLDDEKLNSQIEARRGGVENA
jgi:hypothetical protein